MKELQEQTEMLRKIAIEQATMNKLEHKQFDCIINMIKDHQQLIEKIFAHLDIKHDQ